MEWKWHNTVTNMKNKLNTALSERCSYWSQIIPGNRPGPRAAWPHIALTKCTLVWLAAPPLHRQWKGHQKECSALDDSPPPSRGRTEITVLSKHSSLLLLWPATAEPEKKTSPSTQVCFCSVFYSARFLVLQQTKHCSALHGSYFNYLVLQVLCTSPAPSH